MAKKLLIKLKPDGYRWNYCSLGGVVRVKLSKGEDIAHLGELDQKMWTTLSCPTKELRFDARTLQYLDSDGDGKIKVPEVVAASRWLCSVIKDKESLVTGNGELALDNIDTSCEEGKRLYESSLKILERLSLDKKSISVAETSDFSKILSDDEAAVWDAKAAESKEILPFGNDTEAALSACEAIDGKIRDYFMRCRLVAFNEDTASALDPSVEKIGAVSGDLLSDASAEIAACPLAKPRKSAVLPFGEINPAWRPAFESVKKLVLESEFKNRTEINESDWDAVIGRFGAFKDWKSGKEAALAEGGKSLMKDFAEVDKLVRYYRNFYSFLHNYVVFSDFYSTEDKAMFEAGELYIDQRCCKLCIKVNDMAAHADMAALSGMFLIYCSCTSKVRNDKMDIVAVMTYGDVRNLRLGKNAVFYDRDGCDWDAVVTKIVDNPISIRQAFWSPYRKFANFISEKISKSASEKENSIIADMKQKADSAVALPASAGATTASVPGAGSAFGRPVVPQMPFDIAKFAGIFAAIGMALGYIGAFLTEIVTGVSTAPLWKTLLIILAILLCISGPSCFIAWVKLRKRNLGPVLNANGWAINSVVFVNIVFGATLTSFAEYPKLAFDDPFAVKKTPVWVKLLVVLLILAGIAAALYFTGHLTWAVSYFG